MNGSAVGELLREWRRVRGMSQLELAMNAGFSSRHVSFIETGRAQPSREAVLVLAEALDVPPRERNRLLDAAGYAHVYRQTSLEASEMAHLRGVLQFILARHDPYPALILDRHANCILGNAASKRLVEELVDPSLISENANHLRLVFHPLGARRWIVNWNDVAHALLSRAERELRDDDTAADLLAELRAYAGPLVALSHDTADLLLPIHIRKGDLELRLFTTIMTIGTPRDLTLQELRIETFFPADEESERHYLARN